MIKKVKVTEVISNPNNPRLIKDDKFRKLVKSIQEFPDMLNVRPLVVNKDMVVLGGNMRLKAIKEAGIKEISIEIVDWTEDQQKEFIIKDNVGFGEWNWDDLANDWDEIQLTDWGLDIPDFNKGIDNEEGEIKISTELDQHSNYIVLKFNTDIDWLQVQSIFGLESTYSLRQNGKTWSKGVGRVIDGIDAILKIKESSNEG
ncbi:MAG TPA: hypothetical protein DEB23_02485 [Chitinophagaceae bacterium]|nr:hypothetical protein [Chitinophagaceae bacterium]